ncbi:MAG TPA: DUF6599 family protein [Terriglobales bacterium]|nr:DUF6599 family protein [Terriglobales bacterium]
MKRLLVLLSLLFAVAAYAAPPKASVAKAAVLPKVFAGWQLASSNVSTDPAKADPAYADLLKEDKFNLVETAEYTKPGRKMSVKAARFDDATGAYAAYLFYRGSNMAKEDIGDQAASNNEHVLFRQGDLLLDINFDRLTPMSPGELRELASELPQAQGSGANVPNVAGYLPTAGMNAGSVRFAQGPVGLARIDSPLPVDLIDFSTDAEVASAEYNTSSGTAKLTVISYPEPAIAGNRLRAIQAWHPVAANGQQVQPSKIYAKRAGRLVAVVTGNIPDDEAKTLLASVSYDPDVTWNQNTHFDRNSNIGSLLVNVIILVAVISLLAVVAGFAFGGVRIILKRLFPDRVFDRSEDVEIIRLNIGKRAD